MAEHEPDWIDVIPAMSFGGTGETLGYYYKIAHYLVIVPVSLLIVVAIVYNVLVGIATAWMYKHAWRKGGFMTVNSTDQLRSIKQGNGDDLTNVPIAPGLPTTIWEEIFTVNIKIANYLFGGIEMNDHQGYLILQIHDYIVFMPLAIVFIQICQLAVAMILVMLYVNYLVLQVSHSCDSGHSNVDCFDASDYNMSSLPLDCDFLHANITKFTCFHLKLNPVVAAAVTGGFLKVAPTLMFSSMTYIYLKMLKFTQIFVFNKKIFLASRIAIACVAEILFIGAGVVTLVVMLKVETIRTISVAQADPLQQMTVIFCFVFYFLSSCFVWCVYPLTDTPIRFQNSVWKQKLVAARGLREKSPGKLRPWIVVDRSLETEDKKLLTDEED